MGDFLFSLQSLNFQNRKIPDNDNCSKGHMGNILHSAVSFRGRCFPKVLSLESCKFVSFSDPGKQFLIL